MTTSYALSFDLDFSCHPKKKTMINPSNPSYQPLRRWLAQLAACSLAWACSHALGQDYSATILSQQPVGYWRLEETTAPTPNNFTASNSGSSGSTDNGTYSADVVRGEPGALFGDTSTSSGFLNPGVSVGYVDTTVDIPNDPALNPNGPFSVEFWAKSPSVLNDLFSPLASLDASGSSRSGYLFYAGANAAGSPPYTWQFRMGDTTGYRARVFGGSYLTNTWQHIVGVYDGTNAVIYVDGVPSTPLAVPSFAPNTAQPFRIGATTLPNRGWNGWIQEVAFYSNALTANVVTSHRNTGLTNGAAYSALVKQSNPVGYWRLGEAPNAAPPVAANLGSLGSLGNGGYNYGVAVGQPGPRPADFPGFPAGNLSVGLNGNQGYVSLPALNLNTNTLTISTWLYSSGTQNTNVGIVFTHTDSTVAGLKTDVSDPNGLAYDWAGIGAAANFKSSLTIPDSKWTYVALTVRPDIAVLAIQDGTGFSFVTNYDASHNIQPFEGQWQIGTDSNSSSNIFNGFIDEVAIFNRALTLGELFTEFAAAAGKQAPQIFSGADGPSTDVSTGDSFTVTADAGGTPPLSYQWQVGSTAIPGATNSTYSKASAALSDIGNYSLIVKNAYGSVTSPPVSVNVITLSPPAITTAPAGRSLYLGGNYTLSVIASGGQLHYQWSAGGKTIPGATNASLAFTSLASTNSGSYTVTVSNPLGTVTSAPAVLSVIVPAPNTFEASIVGDKPEAWWRFNETPGSTALLDSMGNHDGIYVGTGVTPGLPGVIRTGSGASASFDGTASYGQIPYSSVFNPKTNFTVEAWALEAPGGAGIELSPISSFSLSKSSGRGYGFLKTSGDFWWGINGNNDQYNYYYAELNEATLNQWTHLALVADSSGVTFYQDGKYVGGPYGNYVPNVTDPFLIGGRNNDGGVHQFWVGQIAEVAFYRSALTAKQIADHYNGALYGTNSAPVFIVQPISQTVAVGQPLTFKSRVEGSGTISLQWEKDGVELAGKTNNDLTINSTLFSSAGVYQLVASNAVGTTTSSNSVLTVVPTPVYANITNGLVLHLTFDADASDSSGQGHNGTYSGNPTLVPGIIGTQALHYSTDSTNGIYNYVSLGVVPDLQFSTNVNFSVSLWIRTPTNALTGDLPFFCNTSGSYNNPGYTFAPSYKQGGWSWSLGVAEIYGPNNSINDGHWHHLVYTFDRATVGTTYLDGILVDSRPDFSGGDLDTGNPTNVGQDGTGTYGETGASDLDDLGVWRRVLTPFEAFNIYTVGRSYGASFDSSSIPSGAKITLTYQPLADGSAQIFWAAGTLQSAPTAKGPWTSVSGSPTSPYTVTPAGAGTFYRASY